MKTHNSQIIEKQAFGAIIDTETIVLTRNEYACVCPLSNRVAMPVQSQIAGGGTTLQIQPPYCTSNCPFFNLEPPVVGVIEPNDKPSFSVDPTDKLRFSCEATGFQTLIAPDKITATADEKGGLNLVK